MFTRKTKLIAVTAALGLGALAVPGTAFAANPTGQSVSANGSYSVGSVFAIKYVPVADPFTFAPSPDAASSTGGYAGEIDVESNDAAGYSVTEQASSFTGPGTPIPNTAFEGPTYTSANEEEYQPFTTTTPLTFVSMTDPLTGVSSANNYSTAAAAANPPSGYDGFIVDNFTYSNGAPVASAGTYSGTVTFTLWSN